MKQTPRLGVNVDHIATLRNARKTPYPDPLLGAKQVLEVGAYGITVHLREDRRHILDEDVKRVPDLNPPKFNLEMALTDEMVEIACQVKPDFVCLVPEKREELTTEGGLALHVIQERLSLAHKLKENNIGVSLFLEPNPKTLSEIVSIFKPDAIEMHTGSFAIAYDNKNPEAESHLKVIQESSIFIIEHQIECHAGHGLHLENVVPLLEMGLILEYNIGHAIVSQSVFDGLKPTVKRYVELFERYPLSP